MAVIVFLPRHVTSRGSPILTETSFILLSILSIRVPISRLMGQYSGFPSDVVLIGELRAQVVAHIKEGCHLYSTSLPPGGPIPTRIWLAEGQSFQLAAPVKAPNPITFQDPNFNMEVEFFAGDAAFALPLGDGRTGILSTQPSTNLR